MMKMTSMSKGMQTNATRDVYFFFLSTLLAAMAMELINCFLTNWAILAMAMAKPILIKHNFTREKILAILSNFCHEFMAELMSATTWFSRKVLLVTAIRMTIANSSLLRRRQMPAPRATILNPATVLLNFL